MLDQLFTQVVLGFFSIIGAIITYILVPYLKQKKAYNWVKLTVQSAEQIFVGTGLGEKKKAWVINKLNELGVKVNKKQLDVLIESAVMELNKSFAN